MAKKWVALFYVIAALTFIFFIGGCGTAPVDNGVGVGENGEVSYPLTVKDYAGRELVIDEEPERIISLMPSNTEILFALGLEEHVIGVTDFCNYPGEAIQKTKVGDSFNINMEKVVSLEPDLVLAAGEQESLAEALLEMGITAAVIDPHNMEETLESIELIGRMTGRLEEADSIVEKMKEDIAAITEVTTNVPEEEKPKVLVLLDTESLFTAGKDTFMDELITMAGGKNIAGEAGHGYFELSEEQILAENPDIIISTFPMKDEIMKRENWQELNALKEGSIYDVEGDIVSCPGPRLTEGLKALYELFGYGSS